MTSSNVEWTHAAEKALQDAVQLAGERSHGMLTALHLAVALIADSKGMLAQIATKLGAVPATVHRQLAEKMGKLPTQSPAPPKPSPSQDLQAVLNKAEVIRNKFGDALIAADHLILSLHEASDCAKVLDSQAMANKQLERIIEEMRGGKKITNKFQEANYEALSKYATDVCKQAEEGKLDPVIGRDVEIRRTIQVLSRRTKNNPVLIGEPGVGKTAIVEGLAQRIVRGDVPEGLANTRIWSLDMSSLVAGASYKGQFEERLKAVLKEVTENQDTIILFMDEIHTLMNAGKGEGSMDAANMLKPLLARGELRSIGATTMNEYRQHIEKDAAFERRFQPVTVNEPSLIDTISILRGLKNRFEVHHGITIQDGAIVAAATLAGRYLTARFQPDKSIDLLDEAAASVRVQLDSRPEQIDFLERKKMQLEIEQKALDREKKEHKKSAQRVNEVVAEIQRVNEELLPLLERYEAEKSQMDAVNKLQAKLEEKKTKLAKAERERDMEKAADLKYAVLPELEAAIAAEKEKAEKRKKDNQMLVNQVTEENISQIVSRWTGVPVTRLNQSERTRLLTLGDTLQKTIKGQKEAVDKVSEAILRNRAGLSREHKPISSFLAIGSSGVGKTQLAIALAKEMFDSEKFLLRIDMSEYMERHNVSKLIGASAGYVGYGEGSVLTEPVRRHPYQVVLFDEVEKAHPDVLNILLQVLDAGRLTDGQGRTVDFSNTIVILTSNLGSRHLVGVNEASPAAWNDAKEKCMKEIRAFFRPEFLNRLDDIVMFHKLGATELHAIIGQSFENINARLVDKQIVVTPTSNASDFILKQSYDPEYGARPVIRYCEREIVTELSKLIIGGDLNEGSEVTVDVDSSNSKLTFAVRRGRSAAAVPSPTSPPSPLP